jgi:phage tail sheath protein FI
MPEYLSPGVYVEEVPSAVKPIAGVSTSTAGFIGVVPDVLRVPPTFLNGKSFTGDARAVNFDLDDYPVVITPGTYQVSVAGVRTTDATLVNNDTGQKSQLVFTTAPAKDSPIRVDYTVGPRVGEQIGTGDGTIKTFSLNSYPVAVDAGSYQIRIGTDATSATAVPARLDNILDAQGNPTGATATITDPAGVASGKKVFADYLTFQLFRPVPAADQTAAGVPAFDGATLCTNFTEYKNAFGESSLDLGQRNLTQAVYGFFNNGGTRCYVVRLIAAANIDKALAAFELVNEIAIVAAPGLLDANTRSKVVGHCQKLGDRFAILDSPRTESDITKLTKTGANTGYMPDRTDYAAWYFPWIKVFDPVAKKYRADAPDGTISVPPSGHIAGIYARVDDARGVHKAPANEAIMGALDVTQRLSKAHQDTLNPKGVNCIRVLNDNILVWGARTVGGDANADVKYINVRRTLLFIRKSIDEGTQWVVFEPNNPALWQKITRNVSAFLTNVWRSGALFGNTPQEAFYVKCDKETNPQSAIDNGQVVTEVGVAIVRPAEFVIFRISQMAGAGS